MSRFCVKNGRDDENDYFFLGFVKVAIFRLEIRTLSLALRRLDSRAEVEDHVVEVFLGSQ